MPISSRGGVGAEIVSAEAGCYCAHGHGNPIIIVRFFSEFRVHRKNCFEYSKTLFRDLLETGEIGFVKFVI